MRKLNEERIKSFRTYAEGVASRAISSTEPIINMYGKDNEVRNSLRRIYYEGVDFYLKRFTHYGLSMDDIKDITEKFEKSVNE